MSLPTAADVSAQVTLWQPVHGGHVGFAQGRWPGHVLAMPEAVCGWLADHVRTVAASCEQPETPVQRYG